MKVELQENIIKPQKYLFYDKTLGCIPAQPTIFCYVLFSTISLSLFHRKLGLIC
jgi:hypothetical protein